MDAESARELFAPYANDYDRVNSIISLRLDRRWRRWVASRAVGGPGTRMLDTFAGTGLVGIEAAAKGARVTLADASEEMLRRALANADERGVRVSGVKVDLTARGLPFAPASFDAVTVSFGLRYLDDPADVLRRLRPLLAGGGKLVVLEFVRPKPGLVSSAAGLYFFRLLPLIAGRLAGRAELYDYLVRSVDRIGDADDLAALVEHAGYHVVERRSMGFGIVAGLVCLAPA